MPIVCPLSLSPISDESFDKLDAIVMTCAYASHNDLGRLCDERVYENDIADRLRCQGIDRVHSQVPVTVSHDGFTKTYRLDLVVEDMVYEIKTVAALVGEHEAQAIHYAILLGIERVKLLNFRTPRVQGLLKRSPMHRVDRRLVTLDPGRWHPASSGCEALLRRLQEFVADVGAFLDARLYEEALIHFSGGELQCLQRMPLRREGLFLGTHRLACHSPGLAFVVTSFSDGAAAHERHLRRLVNLTELRALHWFNFVHAQLEAVTLTKSKE
jgi:GxxExxY protein